MGNGRYERDRFSVQYSRWLDPQDYLRFIHFNGFTSDWKDLGLDDDDLRILQIQMMLAPTAGAVVPGTGGLRKTRFAPPSWARGKRGAVRVLYSIFPDHSVAVLAAAYRKSDREDISPGERKALKEILREIGVVLGKERPRTKL